MYVCNEVYTFFLFDHLLRFEVSSPKLCDHCLICPLQDTIARLVQLLPHLPRRKSLTMIDEDAVALQSFAGAKRRRADNDGTSFVPPPTRKRLDSSSDEDSDSDAAPPRKSASTTNSNHPHGSDSDSDSDNSDSDAAPRRRGNAGSASDSDSDSDAAPPRRSESPTSSTSSSSSSSSLSGLISAEDFQKQQVKLAKKKAKELARAEKRRKRSNGGNGDNVDSGVVHRDGQGNIINFKAKQKEREQAKKHEQHMWATGKAQREKLLNNFEHMKDMANAPFAQDANSTTSNREQSLRNRVRVEDPMAQFDTKEEESGGGGGSTKPKYRGPPGPSNRFGLLPGYRWDGVNRGIGFEQKVIELRRSGKMK
jgi:pre-mRNA-splicing factor CWC26